MAGLVNKRNRHLYIAPSSKPKSKVMKRATHFDMMDILKLLFRVKLNMEEKGQSFWDKTYPTREDIEEALKSKGVFLYYEYDILKGMFVRSRKIPKYLRNVVFKNTKKPVYLSKLCVHPKYRRRGHGSNILDFVLRYAALNKFDSIRCSVDRDQKIMIKMLENFGFKRKKKLVEFRGRKHIVYELLLEEE